MGLLLTLFVAYAVTLSSQPLEYDLNFFKACAAEQIYLCGDVICESTGDRESIIASSVKAVQFCMQEKKPSETFFEPEIQKDLLRCTIFDEDPESLAACFEEGADHD